MLKIYKSSIWRRKVLKNTKYRISHVAGGSFLPGLKGSLSTQVVEQTLVLVSVLSAVHPVYLKQNWLQYTVAKDFIVRVQQQQQNCYLCFIIFLFYAFYIYFFKIYYRQDFSLFSS